MRKVPMLLLTGAAAIMMCQPAFALDHDVVILHTNDVHCGIEGKIGYAGVASYKEQMEEETPYVTLVDAGDAIQGAPVGTLSEGEALIQIMNQVGYDFAIPGNHEFDYGMERFLSLANQLNCRYYSCNFVNLPGMETVLKPYKLVDYDDIKVAYVGASTPESITKSTPKYFQDVQGRYRYGFCEDATGDALYAQIQKYVDKAKAEGADYVVLAGHLGNNGTTPYWSSESVIKNTTGIDVVIDGHSHETGIADVLNKDGKPVVLTQTGTKLANIGKITITTDGEIKAELTDSVEKKESEAVKAVEDKINEINAQFDEALKTVLAHTDVELTDKNPATGERAVRNSETNLVDFCADAMRFTTGADIGIINGGGLRADIKAGDITYEDALNVYPYGNMICVVEVTGQQIKDALELGVKNYPEESGGFIHVSGMSYTIDSSVPSSVVLDEKRNFVGVSGEYRVKDILVGNEPLDVNKKYTLASHNYWLKSGGDGMTMLTDNVLLKDEFMVDVDTLTTYVSQYLNGSVGQEYADPKGQGRIVIK